jgi:hypothetical protein
MFDTFTNADKIAFLQLLGSLVAGVFALYLFWLTVKEKRQMFRISMYDRIYGNPDVIKVFYRVDKEPIIESIEHKVDAALSNSDVNKSFYLAEFEKEVDTTLKYLDFIGFTYKRGDIKYVDLEPFEYELKNFLEHQSIRKYLNYLKSSHGLKFNGLDFLIEKMSRK